MLDIFSPEIRWQFLNEEEHSLLNSHSCCGDRSKEKILCCGTSAASLVCGLMVCFVFHQQKVHLSFFQMNVQENIHLNEWPKVVSETRISKPPAGGQVSHLQPLLVPLLLLTLRLQLLHVTLQLLRACARLLLQLPEPPLLLLQARSQPADLLIQSAQLAPLPVTHTHATMSNLRRQQTNKATINFFIQPEYEPNEARKFVFNFLLNTKES